MERSVICDEIRPILDIEGYAQIGAVKDVEIIPCGKNKSYIAVKLADNSTVCSPCIESDAVKMSIKTIAHYTNTVKLVYRE